MRKFFFLLPVLAVPVVLILMSYHTGSPGGRTGSPGDNGNTCTGCHTGAANNAFAWITTNVPASGYVGGETYTITATGTHVGVVLFGFELTVEDSQGNKVGTLQLTNTTRTKFTNGGDAVTHTDNGITPAGNSNSWSMNWVAPASSTGTIGIYAAFNAANGNGSTSGDVIYKSSTFISPYTPPPALTSIIPDEAMQGESFLGTINAQNTTFVGSTPEVSLSLAANPGEIIAGTNVTVINNTTLTAEFDIPLEATPGLWDIHVDELVLAEGFTVNLVSGVGDDLIASARIYPNPATERFFIENASGMEVMVYNASGAMISSGIISASKHEIHVNGLSQGVYFVKISEGKNFRVEKLLVN